MKKIILLLTFSVGLSAFSLAQTKDQKHIDKGDFGTAEKNLTKDLEKKPTDIAAHYTMALLHINRGYQSYNAPKAYEYISNAISYYSNLTDEKEIKDLIKIPLKQDFFEAVSNTICKEAFEDANQLNTVEGFDYFLDYYKRSPQNLKDEAVANRNSAAFKIASTLNTVSSYQNFISTYPNAQQVKLATTNRNALAFGLAKATNTIKEYEKFISTYPAATEVEEALTKIHVLAFAMAQKENSSKSYKAFMDKYPKSKQFTESKKLYQERQFLENTTVGDWESYRGFIENFDSNPWIENAKDSIFGYGEQTQDLIALKYVAKKYSGGKKKAALLYLHDLITVDGEKKTLDEFYEEFDDPSLQKTKATDYASINQVVNKVEILSKVLGINGSQGASILKIKGGHRTGAFLGTNVMEFFRPKGSNTIKLIVTTKLYSFADVQTENFTLNNDNITIVKNKGAYGTSIIEAQFDYSKFTLELFNYLQDEKDAISIEIEGDANWKHYARIIVNADKFQEAANYLTGYPINIAEIKIYETSPEYILGKVIRFKDYSSTWGDCPPEIAEHDFQKEMTYDEAVIACSKLGDGWRLPSIDEYEEIQRWDRHYKWNNLKMQNYWTNQIDNDKNSSWYGQVVVYDTKSHNYVYQKKNEKFFVRAVKGKVYKKGDCYRKKE